VVAVSDREQLEEIKNQVRGVKELRDKLKYWDYEEILRVHEGLEFVNVCINNLGLVPQGF
jgi:CCR4-NOT transcriptional regulation complex NOT5 subunit